MIIIINRVLTVTCPACYLPSPCRSADRLRFLESLLVRMASLAPLGSSWLAGASESFSRSV